MLRGFESHCVHRFYGEAVITADFESAILGSNPSRIFFFKFDFISYLFFTTTMDQLCEPIDVNRKFIKLIETTIQPKYERALDKLFQQLKQEINKKYLKKTSLK